MTVPASPDYATMEPMGEREIRASWTTWDGARVEQLTVRWENGGWTLDGRITAVAALVAPLTGGADAHRDLHYVVRTDAAWQVRQFLLFRDAEDPDLWLATAGDGRWGEVNGAARDDLAGCTTIHLDDTTIGHTLAVRARELGVGASNDSLVAVVDAETLLVRAARRRTTRVMDRTWRFADAGHGPSDEVGIDTEAEVEVEVEVEVDEDGLVLDHPGRFRRVR